MINQFETWIKDFVKEYDIDGLRIECVSPVSCLPRPVLLPRLTSCRLSFLLYSAAKHVREDFWPPFCEAAGVFCIGEVFGEDLPTALRYASNMDAIMNYPVYFGMMDAFQLPGPQNISSLVTAMEGVNKTLPVSFGRPHSLVSGVPAPLLTSF